MRVAESNPESATVELSSDELRLVNNALNEIVNGVSALGDDAEFQTRLGATRGEARRLLDAVSQVLDSAA